MTASSSPIPPAAGPHRTVAVSGSTPTAAGHQPDIDFETLVGCEGWARLPLDIRQRFSEKPAPGRPIRYGGLMSRVDGSLPGALLGRICRLIGTPFPPYRDAGVPVAIALLHDPKGGIVWEREYRYAGRAPAVVRSVKRIGADGTLLECIGFGLGMRLAVFEANRSLHFLSTRYFWRIGNREFRLPSLLTPGVAHVVHEDLGNGAFRFGMTIHHRLFGMLFEQEGVFRRDAAPQPGVRS